MYRDRLSPLEEFVQVFPNELVASMSTSHFVLGSATASSTVLEVSSK